MSINWLEWFGYLASVIVAASLMMSSIVKLRWFNLFGAGMFSVYGFIIGALPVGFLNLFIALVDIYYLAKIYTEKEYFKILEVRKESKYPGYFFDFHAKDIKRFFPDFHFEPDDETVGFYLLRNMVPAGVFLGKRLDNDVFFIELDYVIPEYRDFKLGKYIFSDHQDFFASLGFKKFRSYSSSDKHDDYLIKMGFREEKDSGNKVIFSKDIVTG